MNAINRLLADHKMIRKTWGGVKTDNPRFPLFRETIHRIILGHAWFEDTFLLPALRREPKLEKRFVNEIAQEHEDIAHLLKLIHNSPLEKKEDINSYLFQLGVILDTHFKKEEDGLFPLAEMILKSEGLIKMGLEMEKRKTEVRTVTDPIED